jgi:hypothetical protein
MWFLADGWTYPVIEAGRPSMQQDLGRQVIPLLRARHDAGLKAASLGRGIVEGVQMDRVRITNAGVDVTLGLDDAGKILSASFIDRSATGQYGVYTFLPAATTAAWSPSTR